MNGNKVLIRPEVADKEKKENLIIGDPRVIDGNTKVLHREVVDQKILDGWKTLRITVQGVGGTWGARGS